MKQALRFQDNVGLIHLQAKKGFKWADGAHSNLTYEDMYQVASIAFCIAAEGFNPDLGHKFSTYYSMVAFSEFRKEIGIMTGVKKLDQAQRDEIEACGVENARRAANAEAPISNPNYGLDPIQFSSMPMNFDDEQFESTLESDCETPEQLLEFKQEWEQATANLSPLAQLVVEWLRDPPPELVAETERQAAFADVCAAQGKRTKIGMRDGVSIGNVSKFLALVGGVPKGELTLVEAELMNVVKRIEEI